MNNIRVLLIHTDTKNPTINIVYHSLNSTLRVLIAYYYHRLIIVCKHLSSLVN